MTERLFEEGGPHRIQNTPDGQTHMHVDLPEDEQGMIGRDCGAPECSPGFFKVKPGTGIVDEPHDLAFCPYCRHADHPSAFDTAEQERYATEIAEQELVNGVNRMLGRSLVWRRRWNGILAHTIWKLPNHESCWPPKFFFQGERSSCRLAPAPTHAAHLSCAATDSSHVTY